MKVLISNTAFAKLLEKCCHNLNEIMKSDKLRYNIGNIFIVDEIEYEKYLDERDINFPLFQKHINISLGIAKENVICRNLNNGELSNLIIINSSICEKIELNQEEISSVIAHELGHIFNKYPEKPLPSLTNLDKIVEELKKIDEIKKENQLHKEINADSFALLLGLKNELLSSIKKYIQKFPNGNHEIFKARVEKIKSSNK